ncbi:hypothetical protein LUZ60_007923 [Juncus effusus]|nr:hypothetical protein LUZ60_007923 [Juncus effusus]
MAPRPSPATISAAVRRLSSASSLSSHLHHTRPSPSKSSSHQPEPISSPHSNPNPNLHLPYSRSSYVPSNSVLASLSSNPSIFHAHKLFDEMLHRNIPLNTLGFGLYISKRAKQERDMSRFLQTLDEIKKRNQSINGSIVAFLIINSLCKLGRKDEAWKLLEGLRNIDFKPDFISYRIVSEEFRLANQFEEERKILKQKRKLSVAPRERDYKEFIYLLINEKRFKEAKEIGEAIIDGNFPIEENLLNALIGFISDFDFVSAMNFCKYMVKIGKIPSVKSLSNLCRNLCKEDKLDELCEILGVILEKNHLINVYYYRVSVSFLCKGGKVREAYKIIKNMRREKIEVEIFLYNCLMRALCKNDLLRPAKKLWDEMFINGCKPNLQTYNIMIKKFSENKEGKEAKGLFVKMLEKGVFPDNYTYLFLIEVFCRENNLNEAIWALNNAIEQDIKLGNVVLNYLVFSLCKEGKFEEVFGVISGIDSNTKSLESHCSAIWNRGGRVEEVVYSSRTMVEENRING